MSQTTQQDNHLDERLTAQLNRMIDERLQRFRKSTSVTDEATERVTEIFDTGQPIDSVRGTPPLLSRTTEKWERQIREQMRERIDVTRTDSTAAKAGMETKAESTTNSTLSSEQHAQASGASHEETKCGKGITWVSLALSLLSLAIIAITIKRLLKQH